MKPIILLEYPLDKQDKYLRGLTDGVEGCVTRCVQREEFKNPYEFTKKYYRQVFEEMLNLFSFESDEVFKLSYFYRSLTQDWSQHRDANGLADLKEVSESYRRVYRNELQYVYVNKVNEKHLRLQKSTKTALNNIFLDPSTNTDVQPFELLTITTFLKLPTVLIKEDTDTFQDNSLVI